MTVEDFLPSRKSLRALAMKLVEDLTYVAVDPRIDFEARDV